MFCGKACRLLTVVMFEGENRAIILMEAVKERKNGTDSEVGKG
ncbi:MAG: hypothetical protein ABW185_26665 [Sedimenticola sp.]